MMRADLPDSLRTLLRPDADLRSRCLQASVAQQLFGTAQPVAIAGTQFSVLNRLGAGAMGSVFEIERAGRTGRLALKVLHRTGSEHAYRLRREFRTLSQLGHPNLVILHELFADPDGSAFTMELVRGDDFVSYVRRGGVPDLERLRQVLVQLAEGLWFLHSEGVIHRDLKPSNVLIDEAGRAVLLDFGVALAGRECDVSGTARFMAPEQRAGHTVPASDLYALGVMLELAIREPHAELPELEPLRELARRLQADDPAARPSPRELVQALRPAPRPHWTRAVPSTFVGRSAELAELTRFCAEPCARPRLAYVEGPSGQGKSTLIAELARRLNETAPELWVLQGRCCRRESVRYRALDPLLDALSDALLQADAELVARLERCVGSSLLELFPVLERVPAFAERRQRGASLFDPRERRTSAVASLRALLRELGRERPLLLCIDDVHWLDDESLELIRELLQAPDAPAVCWLCAGRPQDTAELARLTEVLPDADVRRVALSGLDRQAALRLVQTLLPERSELWQWATSLSGGNPFLLCQLGQLAQDSRQLGDDLELERIAELRHQALPHAARQLLGVVALSAQPLSADVLCEAARMSRADIDGALHLLEAQRYVRSTPTQPVCIEPYHDRLAELAQGLIAAAERGEVHRRIAGALERAPNAEHARGLLFHYRRAGDHTRALQYGMLAAQRANERLSFHEAASLFAECLELAPPDARPGLDRARADALMSAGRDREAAAILRQLSQHHPEREQRFALACEAADLFFRSGYGGEAMDLLEPWLRELGLPPRRTIVGQLASTLFHRLRAHLPERPRASIDPAREHERIEVCLLVGMGLSRTLFLQGVDYVVRAKYLLRHGGTVSQQIRTLMLDSMINAVFLPRSGRAERLIERALALCEQVRDPVLQARVLNAAAVVAGLRIDRPVMARHAERAVQLFEAHARGVQMELNLARSWCLIAKFSTGALIEAECQHVIRDAQQRGDRHMEATVRVYLGTVCLAKGLPERMRSETQTALRLSSAGPQHGIYWALQAQDSRADLFDGQPARAHARLVQALRDMRWHGFLLVPWLRIELRYLLALAAVQARGAAARDEVRSLTRKLAREQLCWPRLLADQLQAWLTAVDGDAQRAAVALERNARDLERDCGAWYASGSLLLAHELRGDRSAQLELTLALRERGLPEPRRFLASYAPLSREAIHGSDE